MQVSTARTKRAPTTEAIEPPMKENSNAHATTGTPLTCPFMTTRASFSLVSFCAANQTIFVTLGVLELQRILRLQLSTQLKAMIRIQERFRRSRAPIRMW